MNYKFVFIFSCELLEIICDPPCMNDGKCSEDHNGNYVCFCKPGYSGVQCEHSKKDNRFHSFLQLNLRVEMGLLIT